MLSKYFIKPLKLFPCATIITFFPFFISGSISDFQYSVTLFIVSIKFSVLGNSSFVKSVYFGSFPGYLSSFSSNSGGLTSVLLLQSKTCSSPYFFLVSSLFSSMAKCPPLTVSVFLASNHYSYGRYLLLHPPQSYCSTCILACSKRCLSHLLTFSLICLQHAFHKVFPSYRNR